MPLAPRLFVQPVATCARKTPRRAKLWCKGTRGASGKSWDGNPVQRQKKSPEKEPRPRDTDKETQTKRRAFRLEKKPGWATEETLGRNPKDIKTLGWNQAKRQEEEHKQEPKDRKKAGKENKAKRQEEKNQTGTRRGRKKPWKGTRLDDKEKTLEKEPKDEKKKTKKKQAGNGTRP